MALALYRGVTTAAAPVIRHYVQTRADKGKEDPARMTERFGQPSIPRPDGPVVWIHAASVGESLSMLSVIERLRAERPALNVLFTTGTVSSARILAERLPAEVIHQFVPVDRVPWVRGFLDHWRPDLALWVESEFWPNLLIETHARGVPLVLMNARMSDKSYRGWGRFAGIIRTLLARFDLCLAQSEDEADKLRTLGAPRVDCPGNLKFTAAPLPFDADALEKLSAKIGPRPVWLASSTHPGEEELIAAAHERLASRHPDLLTVIVPRHAGRGAEIAHMLEAMGHRAALRIPPADISATTGFYIANSMGELGLFYRLCRIVFVGGSLVPHGGQNPLEPARLDCAVLHGPHMENFPRIVEELTRGGAALAVSSAETLADEVLALLASPSLMQERGAAGKAIADQTSEILDSVFSSLRPYLDALDIAPPLTRNARA